MKNLLLMSLLVISGMLFAGTSVPITGVDYAKKEKVEMCKDVLNPITAEVNQINEVDYNYSECNRDTSNYSCAFIFSKPLSAKSSNTVPVNLRIGSTRITGNYEVTLNKHKDPPSLYRNSIINKSRDWITNRWNC